MSWLKRVALALVIVSVPFFLITTNLLIIVNSGWLYSYGFEKYDIPARTGIEQPELMRVAGEIKEYFNNDAARLDVRAVVHGVEQPLFNEREILHMIDVKAQIQGLGFLQRLAFFSMVGVALGGIAVWGRAATLRLLGRGFLYGSLVTIGLLAALGVGALIGFGPLFTLFHRLSFSNELWILDPRTDYLIMMFPQGFFMDATLITAGLSLGQAALTGMVTGLLLRRDQDAAAVRIEQGLARPEA